MTGRRHWSPARKPSRLGAALALALGLPLAWAAAPPVGPGALPRGFPPVPVPKENPMTAAKVTLGERLFFETALSSDRTISCASCHRPESAFADVKPLSLGVGGKLGPKNTPSILNAAYAPRLLWDGRSFGLEDQARYPITHPDEMNMTNTGIVAAIEADPTYPPLFAAAFGEAAVTPERVNQAIASFERTLIAGDSPFDRFLGGDEAAIPAAARRGWALFGGKAGCAQCHRFDAASPFFSDFDFHNTGIGWNTPKPDLGRYQVTRDKLDRGKFRTPGLRNVAVTPPYMHDGSIATLAEVIDHYDRGGIPNNYLDPLLKPLALTAEERAELVALLESLTGLLDYRPPAKEAGAATGAAAPTKNGG